MQNLIVFFSNFFSYLLTLSKSLKYWEELQWEDLYMDVMSQATCRLPAKLWPYYGLTTANVS